MPPTHLLPRLGTRTLIALAVVLLAEAALHVTAVRHALPPARPYYSDNVETRLRALERMKAQEGEPTLLFIGSSVVRTNIAPLIFDPIVEAQTGQPRRSFNGGLTGLAPDHVRLYLQHFFLRHSTPRVVAQGVRFAELVETATAEGFRTWEGARLERAWLDDSWPGRWRAAAIENVRLLYYRGTLSAALQDVRLPPNRPRGWPIDRRGWDARPVGLATARKRGLVGEAPIYDAPIYDASFTTGLAALQRTIALCQAQGITFVLINMPEHGDKFLNAPDGRQRYQRYLEALATLATENAVPFLDVTDGDPARFRDDRLFSDYHHMSPAGAEHFTRLLAARYAALHDVSSGRG